jgi:NAD(P)-dependent dehydrogenase (short-subunit alcohol dehydrogenase family)
MTASPKGVVLVTGASSGIGRCCTQFLATRGYHVYAASRNPETNPLFESLILDVRDETSVQSAVSAVIAREGHIDVVVNNAGIAIAGAVEDTSIEEAHQQFDVNFFGILRVCRTVLPAFRRRGSGYIVNIGSIGGLIGIPYQGLYSASKFALEGLSESLRLEVGRFGVHVVLIEPGDYRTGLTDNRRRTAESRASPVYRERCDRALARMAADEQGGREPDAVARLLHRIITHPRPRLRYTSGPAPERAAVWMKRLMPYTFVEKVIDLYYSTSHL